MPDPMKESGSVLPEHLRLALRWPHAERVMSGGGPEVCVCIHGENLAVFCAQCAAFFCSLPVDEINALGGNECMDKADA